MRFILDDRAERWGIIHMPGVEGVHAPVEWLLAALLLLAALAWWARGRALRDGPAGIARFARIAAPAGAAMILAAVLLLITAPGQPGDDPDAALGRVLFAFQLISLVVSVGAPGVIALIVAFGLALGLLWAWARPDGRKRG